MKTCRVLAALAAAIAWLPWIVPSPALARPEPTKKNVKYGPHERHVLDLYSAVSDKPTPLVVFFHGGGFTSLTTTKTNCPPPLIESCLAAGISVASAEYRLSPEVHFPDHFMDCARAIQFLREHAGEYNIDPKRIGASGSSAGAGTALWLAFHDNLADPKSDDAVLRQSTRLACVTVQQAQTSYDPRVIAEWIGPQTARHPNLLDFYGLQASELESPKAFKMYDAASPINYLTADDPPVFLVYAGERKPFASKNAKDGEGIHHAAFGIKLKERMDALDIECVLRTREDYPGDSTQAGLTAQKDMVDFLKRHLGLP
jgi:acetyl esterase